MKNSDKYITLYPKKSYVKAENVPGEGGNPHVLASHPVIEPAQSYHQGHVYYKVISTPPEIATYCMQYNDLKHHQLVMYTISIDCGGVEAKTHLTCVHWPQDAAAVIPGPPMGFDYPITKQEFLLAYSQYLNLI
jgi:hypothetical protein